LGTCNAFVTELWGVLEGLNLARVKGYRAVKLCIDSDVVVKVLKDGKTRRVVGWQLIHKIQNLIEFDWEVKVCHSYSEASRCADVLENMGCDNDVPWHLFDICPSKISRLLLADVSGVSTLLLVEV
ncbi:ribonuclease H, partial [Trifolium pratense]